MENKDEKQEVVPVKEEFDSLKFALQLVSWFPKTIKNLMHSKDDDNIDIIYLAMIVSMGIIAIRKKNDKIRK